MVAPERKGSGAGNSGVPKRRHKVLPLSGKCVCGKEHSIFRVGCYPWFLASTEGVGMHLLWIKGLL